MVATTRWTRLRRRRAHRATNRRSPTTRSQLRVPSSTKRPLPCLLQWTLRAKLLLAALHRSRHVTMKWYPPFCPDSRRAPSLLKSPTKPSLKLQSSRRTRLLHLHARHQPVCERLAAVLRTLTKRMLEVVTGDLQYRDLYCRLNLTHSI